MLKPIVAVGSLLTGAATAAVVVYMQTNPLAFTSAPTDSWKPSSVAPPAAPVYLDAVEDEASDLKPAALVPTPPPPKRVVKAVRKPVAAPAPKVEPTYKPCTDWRDIGVKAVAGPTGAEPRRVRALCLE